MKRRHFLAFVPAALAAPALAQTTPGALPAPVPAQGATPAAPAPAAPAQAAAPATPAAPAPAAAAPRSAAREAAPARRRATDKSWSELTSRQRQRVVARVRQDPARRTMSEADIGRRWDQMTPAQRREQAQRAQQRRRSGSAPA